jgi:hypothetical protein
MIYMKKNEFFSTYKKNLKNFFDFLSSEKDIAKYYPKSLGELINNSRLLNAAASSNTISINIPSIELQLNNPVECGSKTDSFLSIGGIIKFNNDGILEQSISACLSVIPHSHIHECEHFCTSEMLANQKYIVRRFHFDIDCKQVGNDRPISHIQYGGNIHDSQKADASYHLISSIDLPRIPSIPLDVVQVFNFLMHQFENDLSLKFKQPRWRGIVVENDSIWKLHYIESLLESTGKKSTFYEWACKQVAFR